MTSIKINELAFYESLGKGAFGSVRKGTYKDTVVAIKTIKGNINDTDIMREVMFLAMSDGHKNIIKLYGVSIDRDETHLVMEYMDGGSLYHFLHESRTPYTLAQGINWMRQAAEGVGYLHNMSERCVIHRDVKPLNMLLDRSRETLKICDFGFVRNTQTQMTETRGTWLYMAPEVFQGTMYDAKCDVYSIGITSWEVLSRKIPYYEEMAPDNQNVLVDIWMRIKNEDLRPSIEDLIFDCPENIKTLITSCWDKDPAKRPSMQAICDVLKTI